MPVCFQLTKKGATSPSHLSAIDDELRKHFNQPEDPVEWLAGWYNSIGLAIATGKDVGSVELREYTAGRRSKMLDDILTYLEDHYTSTAWRETV